MLLQLPSQKERIVWTRLAQEKMRFYRLSESRIKKVLRRPERQEFGVAPATVALMQRTGSSKHPTEIWLMYQAVKEKEKKDKIGGLKIKIISAWRYPGKSPAGKEIPMPSDIREQLAKIKNEPR